MQAICEIATLLGNRRGPDGDQTGTRWGPGGSHMTGIDHLLHPIGIRSTRADRQCMEGLGTIPGLSAGSSFVFPQILCTIQGPTLCNMSLSVTCTGLEDWRLGECRSFCWVLVDECQVGFSARAACQAGRAAGHPAAGAASRAPRLPVASAVQHILPPACQAAAPAADVPAPLGGHPAAALKVQLSVI